MQKKVSNSYALCVLRDTYLNTSGYIAVSILYIAVLYFFAVQTGRLTAILLRIVCPYLKIKMTHLQFLTKKQATYHVVCHNSKIV